VSQQQQQHVSTVDEIHNGRVATAFGMTPKSLEPTMERVQSESNAASEIGDTNSGNERVAYDHGQVRESGTTALPV
jgi:hypothetical protein